VGGTGTRVSGTPTSSTSGDHLLSVMLLGILFSFPGHGAPGPEEGARTEQAEAPCRSGQACAPQKAEPVSSCPGKSSCYFIQGNRQKEQGPSKLQSCSLMSQVTRRQLLQAFLTKMSPGPGLFLLYSISTQGQLHIHGLWIREERLVTKKSKPHL
jgi:hypothetical protein